MTPLPFAMSFGEWRCSNVNCRRYVAWADAVLDVEEGRLVGVAHLECVE